MMTDYQPVDCRVHSELELAILQRNPLLLRWHDAQGATQCATLLPLDLVTRDQQEFLLAQDGAATLEIRLDHIDGYEQRTG